MLYTLQQLVLSQNRTTKKQQRNFFQTPYKFKKPLSYFPL